MASNIAAGAVRFASSASSASWLRLTNQTAIITGAASGIGSVVAKSFAAEGCNVILADLDEAGIDSVRSECHDLHEIASSFFRTLNDSNEEKKHNYHYAKGVVCDVTNEKHVKHLIREADDIASKVSLELAETTTAAELVDHPALLPPPSVSSILVNCAGITCDKLFSNMSIHDFEKVLDVNLKGTFLTCKEFCSSHRLETLLLNDIDQNLEGVEIEDNEEATNTNVLIGGRGRRKRIGGSIVNIGSIISQSGNVGQANYAASKGGVLSFTKSLAKEMALRHDGIIRANTVLPGFIETPMTQAVPTKVKDKMKRKIAMGNFGTPEDIANLVLFLSSWERSGYITGEKVECSGMISI